jgi:4a-hydroxytetrahydrobiopterin dehydratase
VALQPFGDQEIDAALSTLAPVWRRDGNAIVAELECSDFTAAIALVNAIAAEAERADHHPDILIHGYRRLTITLSTHAAGGLTQRDFALAGAIDALAVG